MAYHDNAQYQKGVACLQIREYSIAVSYFSKAVFLFPQEPQLYLHRGEAFLKAFDVNSAVANFKKAVQLVEQRADPADTDIATTVKEHLTEILDSHGLLYFQRGDFNRAYMCFRDAMTYGGGSTPLIPFHRGIARYKLKQFDEAAADFHSCATESTVRPYQWVALALLVLNSNKFKEAKKYIERGLTGFSSNLALQNVQAVYKHNFETCQAKAVHLIEHNQYEESGRILDDLIDTDAQNAELYRLRSSCLSGLGMYSAAVQDLFESISKSGGNNSKSEQQLSKTLISIADELVTNGRPVQAMEYYTEAIKWNAAVPEWFLKRGDCAHKLGKHENALLDYKHVLDLDMGNDEAKGKLGLLHDEWGVILHNKGKLDVAEVEFGKAINYKTDVALFYFHRAKCRLVSQNHEGAVRDLEMCQKVGTRDPTILKLVQQHCPILVQREVKQLTTGDGAPLCVVIKGDGPLPTHSQPLPPTSLRTLSRRPPPSFPSTPSSTGQSQLDDLRRSRATLCIDPYDVGNIRSKVSTLVENELPKMSLGSTQVYWATSAKGKHIASPWQYNAQRAIKRAELSLPPSGIEPDVAPVRVPPPPPPPVPTRPSVIELALAKTPTANKRSNRFAPRLTVRELRQLKPKTEVPAGTKEKKKSADATSTAAV